MARGKINLGEKVIRFTMSPRSGLASARLLSAPNKLDYIRALVRKKINEDKVQPIGSEDSDSSSLDYCYIEDDSDTNVYYSDAKVGESVDESYRKVDKVVDESNKADWHNGADILNFETDTTLVGQGVSVMLHFRRSIDADIVDWLEQRTPTAPSESIRQLIFEDTYGENWEELINVAESAIKKYNKKKHRIFDVYLSAYQPSSKEAVEQLSYQTNVGGYVKNLIRRDMGKEEQPIYTEHLGQRNFSRFDAFADPKVMAMWHGLKAKYEDVKQSVYDLEDKARRTYLSEEDLEEYNTSAKRHRDITLQLRNGILNEGETEELLNTELKHIRDKQKNLNIQALMQLDGDDYNRRESMLQEQLQYRTKLDELNKRMYRRGVKRVRVRLDVTEPDMISWLENKEYVSNTRIPDYSYWLNMRKNFTTDSDGRDGQYYERQLGNALGFYITQLVNLDAERNGYGDRARVRELAKKVFK